jgi:hypothetical protein
MSFLIDVLADSTVGTFLSGISGLIGGYLTKRENRLQMIISNKHELAMSEVEAKAAEFELKASITAAKHKLDMAQQEGEIAQELAEIEHEADMGRLAAETFKEGVVAANSNLGDSWIDNFRKLTRPTLTWALFLFVVGVFAVLQHQVGGIVSDDTELLVKIYVYLISSMIYLAIMAVSWWFMSRGENSVKAINGMFK